MKTKLLFTLCLTFSLGSSIAQIPELWGTAQSGGANSRGTIFKINGDGTGFTVRHSFANTGSSGTPLGSLYQANNGEFYGMTNLGGTASKGQLFKFNPGSNTFTPLLDFTGTNGSWPYGNVMQANDNKLYGMINQGGLTTIYGFIFSYDISSNTFTDLHEFNCPDGEPFGSLIQASDGKLYGMTKYGGTVGNIFSYDIPTGTYTDEFFFNTSDGQFPYGSLIEVNGKLYGMTHEGGANNGGVLFSFDISNSTYLNLHDFTPSTGYNPFGSLIEASNGKLYGLTSRGGPDSAGVVFSYDISTSTYTKLHDFDTTTGKWPHGSLVQASNGKLYGTTSYGGSNNYGVVFSFDPSNNSYADLIDFNYSNGAIPFGDLIQFSATVGINENNYSSMDINVFPNPFTSQTSITSSINLSRATIIIYNNMGQEIRTIQNISGQEVKLERGNLQRGFYFIRLIQDNKTLLKDKLIIE